MKKPKEVVVKKEEEEKIEKKNPKTKKDKIKVYKEPKKKKKIAKNETQKPKKKKKNNSEDSYMSFKSGQTDAILGKKLEEKFKKTENKQEEDDSKKVFKNLKLKKKVPTLKINKKKLHKESSSDMIINPKNKNASDNETDILNSSRYKNIKKLKVRNLSLMKNKNIINNNELDMKNKSIQSTRTRIKKIFKDSANIKIRIKSPLSPKFHFEEIDDKSGGGKKIYNFFNPGKLDIININSKDKNNIDKRDNKLIKKKKMKIELKPLKVNNLTKTCFSGKNLIKNPFYIKVKNKNVDKNLHFNSNNIHHYEAYEKHFGNEESCPLCLSMQKRSQFMEDMIFGPARQKGKSNESKFENRFELKNQLKKRIMEFSKKEEEKNINNFFRDLNNNNNNYMNSNFTDNRNCFDDFHKKFSFRRNQSSKMFNNKNDTERNNENMSKVEFPAINSYFHS